LLIIFENQGILSQKLVETIKEFKEIGQNLSIILVNFSLDLYDQLFKIQNNFNFIPYITLVL